MPSKLDATLVKDPQAEFGSSYWTFGGLTPRGSEYGYEQDGEPTHGPTSSITVSPARPPDTGSAFASASTNMAAVHSSPSISKQQIPHEFLISPFHQPTRDDYVGLNPFEALDDHWATVDMVPSTHLEMDVPPLQMESVARAVTASLRKH
ncbi:hypothetical protein K439DRAFT_1633168 [Ramaria rubella]|nr:hypothetical protein K439DRAFT_1633168 [Ramaria rubella]